MAIKTLNGTLVPFSDFSAKSPKLRNMAVSPGSIPGPAGVTCGLSLLLVLVLAPRIFIRVLRFYSLPPTLN